MNAEVKLSLVTRVIYDNSNLDSVIAAAYLKKVLGKETQFLTLSFNPDVNYTYPVMFRYIVLGVNLSKDLKKKLDDNEVTVCMAGKINDGTEYDEIKTESSLLEQVVKLYPPAIEGYLKALEGIEVRTLNRLSHLLSMFSTRRLDLTIADQSLLFANDVRARAFLNDEYASHDFEFINCPAIDSLSAEGKDKFSFNTDLEINYKEYLKYLKREIKSKYSCVNYTLDGISVKAFTINARQIDMPWIMNMAMHVFSNIVMYEIINSVVISTVVSGDKIPEKSFNNLLSEKVQPSNMVVLA
jgi:hypothetical protein